MPDSTILIVDDDEGMRDTLLAILRQEYRVLRASSGAGGLDLLAREPVDVVLLDVKMPGMDGFEVLREIKESQRLVEVIMISSLTDVETAVRAMKAGAYHYITKDFEYDAVLSLVRNACERRELNRKLMALSAQVEEESKRPFIVGPSKAMRDVVDTAKKIANLSATALILGESGTGKELLARLLHEQSERADGPFLAVNMAAIPADLVESALFGHERGSFTGAVRQQLGKFELATDGTLFLDEIGELKPDLQVKLLRAIQESEIERIGGSRPIRVKIRLVTATNLDLERAVREGRFREDLYYRINVIPLRLPALRDRIEDLPELTAHFIRRFNTKYHKRVVGIEDPALDVLRAYRWPGNIRELENLIERMVAVSDGEWITAGNLPYEYHLEPLIKGESVNEPLLERACETFERNFILKGLEQTGWNVTATARNLGVPLSTLKHKIDRLEIRDLARRLRGM